SRHAVPRAKMVSLLFHADAMEGWYQVTEVLCGCSLRESLEWARVRRSGSLLFRGQGKMFSPPAPNAAVHGEHIGITHLLQIVGGQRGAISTATIEDEGRAQFRCALLDIAFDDALAQVNRL